MQHKLTIDRLFTLGDFKNVHIIAESSEISDDEWNNFEKMEVIRENLTQEVFLNFALIQEMGNSNLETIKNNLWSALYEEIKAERHPEEVVLVQPEPIILDEI